MSHKSTSLQLPTPPVSRSTSETAYAESQAQDARAWIPNPNEKRSRTLVLCFDGTGDKFDEDVSNVIQFVEALKKDDQHQQVVYYQTGIGTYTKSSFVTPLAVAASKTLDLMFAWNLQEHVTGGYKFLMETYTAGDKISIFGFSRGAYVARALAGMLAKIGLLSPCNHQQIPIAWDLYKHEDAQALKDAAYFKKVFSRDVLVDFVGVWDTVASVGLFQKNLPFVANNDSISYFRHALALDERRVKFTPNFYHATEDAAERDPRNSESSTVGLLRISQDSVGRPISSASESMSSSNNPPPAKEVWFAGCHCDIGGGSVKNDTPHSLARIPLRWMIRECFACDTGIIFDSTILREKIGLDTDTLYPVFIPRDPSKRIAPHPNDRIKSWKEERKAFVAMDVYTVKHDFVSEEDEDLRDALSAKYDQLEMKWWWWILEYLPLSRRVQIYSRRDKYFRLNKGKGRLIYGNATMNGINVHSSVKTRLEALDSKGQQYTPRAAVITAPKGRMTVLVEKSDWINDPQSLLKWVD